MGFFGSKSTKEVPSNLGAEPVSGPGAQHVSAPAPNLGTGGDMEDPPMVADAWVVDATPADVPSAAHGGAYAASSPPRMAEPPPQKKFLPSYGRNSAPPGTQPGAVAVPGPPPGAKKSKMAVAIPEADAKRASLLGPGGLDFDRKPAMLDICPNCQQQSRTKIRTYPSILTWAMVVLLFLLFWPLCWIPLVVSKCKATDHTCVKCNVKVGEVKPFEDICEKRRR
eukprot:CAMPEP_0197465910 /NCGR_PEP_ID=MMETSP1175-20131217/64782_1 /TAXON_ID=1003142 /ORGANISM="Triceratium dubium, Strain CCMP147" /LENGTH=223 /DNA_ID=CAMNT_0043001935 /DNA_START=1 /DNA_END=672 /DNA_ORIENTATION=-